jgi:hypothetical protein
MNLLSSITTPHNSVVTNEFRNSPLDFQRPQISGTHESSLDAKKGESPGRRFSNCFRLEERRSGGCDDPSSRWGLFVDHPQPSPQRLMIIRNGESASKSQRDQVRIYRPILGTYHL